MRRFPVMIFAAGFGTRMGSLTKDRPKPLIRVAGKALLDHALDLAKAGPVSRLVVNTHYLADQISAHLGGQDIAVSHESETILETGGGLRKALPLLGSDPVMTLNSDAVWTGPNPLATLAEQWDEARMDALLLMAPLAYARGYGGNGDFVLDDAARLERANGRDGLVYLGAQIIRTDLLASIPQPTFSLNLLWDRMIAKGRAFGVVHEGGWCDVGRPEGIAEAEALLGWSPRG